MSESDSRQARRSGITLIEVVVGLALLGSLLVMMVIAGGRLEKQRKISEEKLEAIAALDSLVSGFFSSGFPPVPSNGAVPGNDRWAWQLAIVNTAAPESCSVARVSIVDLKKTSDPAVDIGQKSRTRESLASVEVLVANSAFGRQGVVPRSP
jgi:type II secretory pathway pseudopilin PulG